MGFFANGTEGQIFQELYCEKCINYRKREGESTEGCPIWDLHLLFNYKQFGSKECKEMLEFLIKLEKVDTEHGEIKTNSCTMFMENKL
jgi:hypothetical protein